MNLKHPSPCSECIVFPMCKTVCLEWKGYMSRTWGRVHKRDKYANEIFDRTLGTYGWRSTTTGPR